MVRYVGSTKIFARRVDPFRQALVYSMKVDADADLAMVLPLPVPPHSPDDAVRFVSLEKYSEFFTDVERAFPVLPSGAVPFAAPPAPAPLVVHEVGAYEASFVPTVADFSRLDGRFRMPDSVWNALPQYADHGFAVFKLKGFSRGPLARPVGSQTKAPPKEFHPMAFVFPNREPGRLFFPTVHVHDGVVHPTATFDHDLYAQTDVAPPQWEASRDAAGRYVDPARAQSLVDANARLYKKRIYGTAPNVDMIV